MEHAAYESAGPGGTLHWKERADRHWVARGMGGTFDVAPHGDGYHTYWMPDGGSFVDLGHHDTLGKAWGAARSYADGTFVRRAAEEPAGDPSAMEGGCAHTHPPSVPSAPCDTPPEGGPVVVEKTEVAASKTVLVAGEEAGRKLHWSEVRMPSGHTIYRAKHAGAEYEIEPRPRAKKWSLLFWAGFAKVKHLGEFPSVAAAKSAAAKRAAKGLDKADDSPTVLRPPKAKRAARAKK